MSPHRCVHTALLSPSSSLSPTEPQRLDPPSGPPIPAQQSREAAPTSHTQVCPISPAHTPSPPPAPPPSWLVDLLPATSLRVQSGLQSHPPPPVPQPSAHCLSLPRLLPFLPPPLTSYLVTKATLACMPWIPALTSPAPFTADPRKPRGSTPSLLLPPTLHCSCPGQGQH